MATRYEDRVEFIRYIYEAANDPTHPVIVAGADLGSETARHLVISHWRKQAVEDLGKQKTLTQASGNGKSAGYSPSDIKSATDLASFARKHVSEADVEDALAAVPGPIRHYGTDFRFCRA